MTDSKKRRMSMLDSLASAGASAPPAAGMMSTNRALRSARDAVDNHHVWELDPHVIVDHRLADRLDPGDVADLRDAIEANGQTVPILVRRDPADAERYLLVYGRRRLEAVRTSDKVGKVRALVTTMDEDSAVRSQISENMARRDLSHIEKALFAHELVRTGFGNQTKVAEVLTVTKSSISMAIKTVETIGTDLIVAIGAAHGIGRPRWDALAKMLDATGASRDRLVQIANTAYAKASVQVLDDGGHSEPEDPSIAAFEAVTRQLENALPSPAPRETAAAKRTGRSIKVNGERTGTVRRTPKGVAIDLNSGPFSEWVETHAQDLIEELHARWIKGAED